MSLTPKDLLELSASMRRRSVAKGDPYDQAAAALRSYAELVSALEWLDGRSCRYRGHFTPGGLVGQAREDGWPGLEE